MKDDVGESRKRVVVGNSNPVSVFPGGPAFRSVSPWEMAAIFRNYTVTGAGATFSGDTREGCLWLGLNIPDVAHNGEDYVRATYGMIEFSDVHSTLRLLYSLQHDYAKTIMLAAGLSTVSEVYWGIPYSVQREHKTLLDGFDRVSELDRKAGEAYRKYVSRLVPATHKWRAKRRGPTSYVLEFDLPTGGVLYTDKDSRAIGPEICWPPDVLTSDDIVAIHLVQETPRRQGEPSQKLGRGDTLSGYVRYALEVWPRPAHGWAPEWADKVVLPPLPSATALKAVMLKARLAGAKLAQLLEYER